jgi:hypothetical protein
VNWLNKLFSRKGPAPVIAASGPGFGALERSGNPRLVQQARNIRFRLGIH